MAATTTYHRLPEEGRPSTESNIGKEESLIGAGPLDAGDDPKAVKDFTFTFHPTVFTRFVAFALLIPAVILLSNEGAVGFISFISLVRNLMVISYYAISRYIRVHIEFVTNVKTISHPTRFRWPNWLPFKRAQVVIDLTIWLLLLLIVTIVGSSQIGRNYWREQFIIDGYICAWVAIPFYLFSIIDIGDPKSITASTTVTFKTGGWLDTRRVEVRKTQIDSSIAI